MVMALVLLYRYRYVYCELYELAISFLLVVFLFYGADGFGQMGYVPFHYYFLSNDPVSLLKIKITKRVICSVEGY